MASFIIADDLTGAAEIAGIAWRYNLQTMLSLSATIPDTDAEVLVLCTDSRSMDRKHARQITEQFAAAIAKRRPYFFYKKIDSVFRGYVVDELKITMQQLGAGKALIIGENPSLGRIIANGHYYINGIPVNETDFANDPEFPVKDAAAWKMLQAAKDAVKVLKHTDRLTEQGIVVGEAQSEKDVQSWAAIAGNDWLPVGSGDFFTALLARHYQPGIQPAGTTQMPHLFVRGTAFRKERAWMDEVDKKYNGVVYLPHHPKVDNEKVHEILMRRGKLIIAYADSTIPANYSALELRTNMAEAVREIVYREGIKEIFIEGGSTAAAVLQSLGITTLSVVYEWQRGVVKMQAGNLFITVKPGSYELPAAIKQLYLG